MEEDLNGLSDWSEISSPKKRSDDIANPMPGPCNEDDDNENGDVRVKQEDGIAQEMQ